jgi:DNA polymerase I-like protein with 3'-5' exonuclease and polymerase domains
VSRYYFDLESDDLLDDLTTIHCLVLKDLDTGERFSYGPNTVAEGARKLAEADFIAGHNIIKFDIPALIKIFPWFRHTGEVFDTLTLARLIWPVDMLRPKDMRLSQAGKMPGHLVGRHSLEAWGHRLGEYKSKKVDFAVFSKELLQYCEQDVEVGCVLVKLIQNKNYSPMAMWLETAVQFIIFEQEEVGVPFDEHAAALLYGELGQRRLDLERECQGLFGPWLARNGKESVPKRDNKKRGIFKGCAYNNLKEVVFNPGSRQHIANRFMAVRGWKPTEFTASGDPEINEVILSKLPYPEARILTKYLTVQKRIGQLAEGKEALLKAVVDGRIHGEMVTNGAVTGRGTHNHPNLGQVPKVRSKKIDGKTIILKGEEGGWGWEFRSLFATPKHLQHAWKFVGADASGLELRMLGHYLAKWDNGAYAHEVVEGDVHSITLSALAQFGLDSRDTAKTWMYAYLYGAGDGKLGKVLKKGQRIGAASRALFLKAIPALNKLVEAVKLKHRTVGHLLGLDRRVLHTRSEHAALNTLLQAAGAVVVKMWMVVTHRNLFRKGYVPGRDFQQVLFVHDELEFFAREEIANDIATICKESIKEVEQIFGLKVPLAAEARIGNSWAEVH